MAAGCTSGRSTARHHLAQQPEPVVLVDNVFSSAVKSAAAAPHSVGRPTREHESFPAGHFEQRPSTSGSMKICGRLTTTQNAGHVTELGCFAAGPLSAAIVRMSLGSARLEGLWRNGFQAGLHKRAQGSFRNKPSPSSGQKRSCSARWAEVPGSTRLSSTPTLHTGPRMEPPRA